MFLLKLISFPTTDLLSSSSSYNNFQLSWAYIGYQFFLLTSFVQTDSDLLKQVLDIRALGGTSLKIELSADFISLTLTLFPGYLSFIFQITFISHKHHDEIECIGFIDFFCPIVYMVQRFLVSDVEGYDCYVCVSEIHGRETAVLLLTSCVPEVVLHLVRTEFVNSLSTAHKVRRDRWLLFPFHEAVVYELVENGGLSYTTFSEHNHLRLNEILKIVVCLLLSYHDLLSRAWTIRQESHLL